MSKQTVYINTVYINTVSKCSSNPLLKGVLLPRGGGSWRGMSCPESCDTLENQLLKSQRMPKPDTRRTARCAAGQWNRAILLSQPAIAPACESRLRGQAHSRVNASVYQKTALE